MLAKRSCEDKNLKQKREKMKIENDAEENEEDCLEKKEEDKSKELLCARDN